MKNKDYSNGMNDELRQIIKNFGKSGKILVAGNRNLIKIFDYKGKSIAIKSFKKPIFINGFIYKYIRDSKARRSFDNANFLISRNIGTPKPIAFYENSNFLAIKESYYICENLEYDFLFRKLLRATTAFSYRMHENGIEFLDHSPGNTLIKIDENDNYHCYLVDLNRMKFHKEMSLELRMKNLNKLTPSIEMVAVIANEYSKLSNFSESKLFNLLSKYVVDFYKKYDQKIILKKKLMFWKRGFFL